MDELVDILDENGNLTGETAMKSEAHSKGLFHPTIHVWCYTDNGQVLLQQRARNKETHPLLWDVSVAGHIGAGENTLEAAVREVGEEIGLSIKTTDLQKIGFHKSMHQHPNGIQDNEFHHIFLCKLKVPLESLKKQDSEVATLQLVPLTVFAIETWGMGNIQKYVPHGTDYYKTIVKAIKDQQSFLA